MTLPDNENSIMPEPVKKQEQVNSTFTKVLTRAKNDGRITSGVFECTKVLERNPEKVMLCVLPETAPDDFLTSIQHKLIDAYCLENDIQTVKVDSSEKLSSLINSVAIPEQKTLNENPVTMATIDCSCVLIGYPPKGKKNRYENKLMDVIWPNQVIGLPS